MTTGTETETAIPVCCVMCLAVPSEPGALRNWGDYRPYWLCVDRDACMDRAVAAQHAAEDALMGNPAPQNPAPGTEPATPAPAVPPAGEGAGKLALPGAEDDEQDVQEAPQEELPLEPLPEPVCGLVSNEGETCGRAPGHEGGHGPAEESAA